MIELPEEKNTYEFRVEDDTAVLSVSGAIDTITSREFEKQIVKILSESDKFKSIKFDFRNVSYLSSSGLRVILYTKQELMKKNPDYKLIIEDPKPKVMEILDMTGFSEKIVDVEYSNK